MILRIVIIVVVILALIWFGAGIGLTHIVTKPTRESLEESRTRERQRNFWEAYATYPKEAWNIPGYRGYLLHGELIKNQGKKYVIITHGYTANRYNSIKYAHIFYELGYSVYQYDIRHHGENADDFCSMGYLERRDIIAVKDALIERFGTDIEIGLHGESLGCASSLLALGLYDGFTFCVANCGYSDLPMLLGDEAKNLMHLPACVVHMTTAYMLLAHHYSFYKVKPIEALESNRTPILFIHGAADNFIDPVHSQRMYDSCTCQKQLVYFENAGHAQSYDSDPERYQQVVAEFLQESAATP